MTARRRLSRQRYQVQLPGLKFPDLEWPDFKWPDRSGQQKICKTECRLIWLLLNNRMVACPEHQRIARLRFC